MTLLVVNNFVFVCSKIRIPNFIYIYNMYHYVPIYIYSYSVLFFLTQLKTRATMAHILQENLCLVKSTERWLNKAWAPAQQIGRHRAMCQYATASHDWQGKSAMFPVRYKSSMRATRKPEALGPMSPCNICCACKNHAELGRAWAPSRCS